MAPVCVRASEPSVLAFTQHRVCLQRGPVLQAILQPSVLVFTQHRVCLQRGPVLQTIADSDGDDQHSAGAAELRMLAAGSGARASSLATDAGADGGDRRQVMYGGESRQASCGGENRSRDAVAMDTCWTTRWSTIL